MTNGALDAIWVLLCQYIFYYHLIRTAGTEKTEK